MRKGLIVLILVMLSVQSPPMAEAGAFAVVLELVAQPVAKEITAKFPFATIGIGSGPDCDGTVSSTGFLPLAQLALVGSAGSGPGPPLT